MTIIGAVAAFGIITLYLAEQWLRIAWVVHLGEPKNGMVGFSEMALPILYYLLWPALLFSYPLRAIRLLFIFRKTVFRLGKRGKQIAEQTPMMPPEEGVDKAAQLRKERRRRKRRQKKLAKLYAVFGKDIAAEQRFIIVLIIIVSIIVIAFGSSQVTPWLWMDTDYVVLVFLAAFIVYALIVFALAASLVLLRHVRDEFTINWELRIVIGIILVVGIPWAVLMYSERVNEKRFVFPPQWLAVILCMACTCVSIVWPLIQIIRADTDVGEMYKKLLEDVRSFFLFFKSNQINSIQFTQQQHKHRTQLEQPLKVFLRMRLQQIILLNISKQNSAVKILHFGMPFVSTKENSMGNSLSKQFAFFFFFQSPMN